MNKLLNNFNFSGSLAVQFQGAEVLTLLELLEDKVKLKIIGFDRPNIFVTDYRSSTISALKYVLDENKKEEFPGRFNLPAEAIIECEQNGDLQITLRTSAIPDPDYLLWVAIGIGSLIPIYDYLFYHFNKLTEEHYAFISLYRRPDDRLPITHQGFLSASVR